MKTKYLHTILCTAILCGVFYLGIILGKRSVDCPECPKVDVLYAKIDSIGKLHDTLTIKEKEVYKYYNTKVITETNEVLTSDDTLQISLRKKALR